MFRERPTTNPKFTAIARKLRRAQTPHEAKLWSLLRDRRFDSVKFRRQVPIGPFVADFACLGAKLIVELDGSQHADDPADIVRDAELMRRGFRVLRIWNNELMSNEAGVLEAIYVAVTSGTIIAPSASSPSPLVGEGARRADEGSRSQQVSGADR